MAKTIIDKLMELKQLYEQGLLTKEEMEVEKAKIFDKNTDVFQVSESKPQVERKDIVDDSTEKSEKNFFGQYKNYIFGSVLIALLAIGWYTYSNHRTFPIAGNLESAYEEMSSTGENLDIATGEESIIVELIKKWDEMHCPSRFNDSNNNLYADEVWFYGEKMGTEKIFKNYQKILEKYTDYQQESTNIKMTRLSENLIVCIFDKNTLFNGRHKVYPSYLYFIRDIDGRWKIKEECDMVSDRNLQKMRERKSPARIVQPITNQFVKEYCDYLRLPYKYWQLVEQEIKKHDLNVTTIDGPESDATPNVLRGRIAMNYKYKNGNTVLEKFTHYYNYVSFCDAIGRIKGVWNVVPVRIENDDVHDSPLFQFRYEGNGLDDVIITAQYVEEVRTYKFIRDDNKKEVPFDLISY